MEAAESTKRLAGRRPAEVAGGTLSVVVGAVVTLFKIDLEPSQVGAIVVLLGFVPTVITWLRTR